jgi:hypothetical protein
VPESDKSNNVGSLKWPVDITVFNDNFADAIALDSGDIETTGGNGGTTKEPGEPDHAGKAGGTSVWWKWTSDATGPTIITTDDSSFDTLLAVYTGSSVTSLTQVGANDDHDGLLTSLVEFNAVAGQTYYIAVDGLQAAYGRIYLSVTAATANDLTISRMDIKFKFKKPNKDSLSISGSVELVSALNPKGTPVSLFIGDLRRDYTLGKNGKSESKELRMSPGRGFTSARFTISLKKQDLFTALSRLGFTNADVKAAQVTVPVILVVGTDSYVSLESLTYKAKAGVGGQARQ